MKIETYMYLEDKKKFVPIDDIEKIKIFVAAKEDFMEQGFTNMEGTITFDRGKKGKIEDFENPNSIEELGQCYKNDFKDIVYQFIESGRQFIDLKVITGRLDDSDLRDEFERIEKLYKSI
ncbi:hypothetical protein [Bacillus pumilus]|uniref:hypothetical protein n=1 Tax=Bacillus pumilus TaxID=1408 RepID=UPI0011E8FD23|nr:hypothetical protein [Bacillus pumilus]TYS32981.1 hypothetical protein FZC65_06320 [Bacillus pumilus]TYS50684.1 hypothetical protein FZC67_04895 [Bacillus pumilus]